MEGGTSSDPVERATGILAQLLKYTQQLAASETDPRVDVVALSEACGRRLDDLKKVLPQALSGEKGKITEKIKELLDQTRLCSEILERARNKAGGELASLSKTRRAIRAYSA